MAFCRHFLHHQSCLWSSNDWKNEHKANFLSPSSFFFKKTQCFVINTKYIFPQLQRTKKTSACRQNCCRNCSNYTNTGDTCLSVKYVLLEDLLLSATFTFRVPPWGCPHHLCFMLRLILATWKTLAKWSSIAILRLKFLITGSQVFVGTCVIIFGDVCWIMWTASAFHDETFCIIYNDKWAMGLHINETLDNIVQWILSKGILSVNGFWYFQGTNIHHKSIFIKRIFKHIRYVFGWNNYVITYQIEKGAFFENKILALTSWKCIEKAFL